MFELLSPDYLNKRIIIIADTASEAKEWCTRNALNYPDKNIRVVSIYNHFRGYDFTSTEAVLLSIRPHVDAYSLEKHYYEVFIKRAIERVESQTTVLLTAVESSLDKIHSTKDSLREWSKYINEMADFKLAMEKSLLDYRQRQELFHHSYDNENTKNRVAKVVEKISHRKQEVKTAQEVVSEKSMVDQFKHWHRIGTHEFDSGCSCSRCDTIFTYLLPYWKDGDITDDLVGEWYSGNDYTYEIRDGYLYYTNKQNYHSPEFRVPTEHAEFGQVFAEARKYGYSEA